MATNLSRLRVSLTKHGAYKVAYLIKAFDKDDILNHLDGDHQNIRIDNSQTRGILSIKQDGIAPGLWNEVRIYGIEDIFDLVFIAIVFSHEDYIIALRKGIIDGCIIKRNDIIQGKAYTNFANIIESLGFAIDHQFEYITFDISRIFYKFYLPPLIAKLLEIKFVEAGWEKKNTLIEECIIHDINSVFGLNPEEFSNWMLDIKEIDDQSLATVKSVRHFKKGIRFKPGHNPKFEGQISVNMPAKRKATLLHNKIQNSVYELLCQEFSPDEIGTEIPTNVGSVDVVRREPDNFSIYEIKTASSVRSNIRQAFSQLMEYAYWGDIKNVAEIIIIAPCSSTNESKNYLTRMRKEFNIPIYYRFFDLKTLSLSPKE